MELCQRGGAAVEHGLRDERDAAGGAPEPARVLLRILAHDEPLGHLHAAVDDGIPQLGAAADVDARQRDDVIERRVGVDAVAGEQQRVVHVRSGDDRVARDQRLNRLPTAPLVVVDELRGRGELGVRPDRPLVVVEVEGRQELGEVDVGLPERVDRADVAPVRLGLEAVHDARLVEAVRVRRAARDDLRDEIVAEIMAGVRYRRHRRAGARAGSSR